MAVNKKDKEGSQQEDSWLQKLSERGQKRRTKSGKTKEQKRGKTKNKR